MFTLFTFVWARVSDGAPKVSVACITFGAPLVGGEQLSRLVRGKGWDGLIHQVIWRHDLVPRALLSLGTGASLITVAREHVHLLYACISLRQLWTWWTMALCSRIKLTNVKLQLAARMYMRQKDSSVELLIFKA